MRRFLLVVAVVGVASLAAGEVLVRTLTDVRPWIFFGRILEDHGIPLMHEPDAELGWISRPGNYSIPLGYILQDPERGDVTITIGEDTARASAPPGAETGAERVVFVGCSYTFGWGVEDDESFVWRVRKALPGVDALNLGTNGYGSYQSLLRMERYLDMGEGPLPALVVYGLITGHGVRDVAEYGWQRMMSQEGTHTIPVPRVSLGADGRLARHPPEAYPVWPLGTRSALVAWAADRYARARADGRGESADRVHAEVVCEMHRVLEAAGTRLLVVLLEVSDKHARLLERELDAAGVDWVSCRDPRSGQPEYRIPVDGHPNAALHAIWAECVAEAVAERTSAAVRPAAPPGGG